MPAMTFVAGKLAFISVNSRCKNQMLDKLLDAVQMAAAMGGPNMLRMMNAPEKSGHARSH
jgi:hypothetical protein